MAGDQVESARKRLASALDSGIDSGKEYGHVKDKATEGAKADVALREHPYKAVATGIGLGPSLAISLRAGARIAPGLLRAIFLAFGAAAFALLGGMTLTGLLVFLFYELAPVTVMPALTILYGTAVLLLLHWRLAGLLRMETIFE